MLKVIVNGALGQMGQVVSHLIRDDKDMELVASIDRKASANKSNFDVLETIWDFKYSADVIIDFSNPSALNDLLKFATTNNIPLVIGTTGYGKKEMEKLNKVAEKIPIFYSANMSLGINLLLSLISNATSVLGNDYDIEIIEKHHNKKIDAPSGTAYMIADKVNEVLSNEFAYVFGRKTTSNKRSLKEIGIHAIRGGTIVGEHSVIFAGLDEIIEIKHSALSKKVFAKGALKAAKFIITQEKGLYNMEDYMQEAD